MMFRQESRLSLSSILPLTSRLPDGRTVIVDFSSEPHLKETYMRLHACGSSGEGVGLDEFPTEDVFRKEITDGDCFSVVCTETSKLFGKVWLSDSDCCSLPSLKSICGTRNIKGVTSALLIL